MNVIKIELQKFVFWSTKEIRRLKSFNIAKQLYEQYHL